MVRRVARIVRDDFMGGEPRVEGRRVTVLRIRDLVGERGLPAAEVAAVHDLDVVDVYTALTDVSEPPEEMAAFRERRRDLEAESRDAGTKTVGELRAELADEEESA